MVGGSDKEGKGDRVGGTEKEKERKGRNSP